MLASGRDRLRAARVALTSWERHMTVLSALIFSELLNFIAAVVIIFLNQQGLLANPLA
jgi:hypothetical protein